MDRRERSCNVMSRGMLRPLLLLQSVDRAVDSLQELWEPWLGTLKLWFRKTGQQESFLSSAVCFYFVFFPLFPFFLNLSLSLAPSLYQTVVWEGMSSYLWFSFFSFSSSLCRGSVVLESAKTAGKHYVRLSSVLQSGLLQGEGLAIWLKQEGIYILNMPWFWQ